MKLLSAFPRERRSRARHGSCALLLLGLLTALPWPARATTVAPPDFDTLVGVSDYIVRATVIALRPAWIETDGRQHIFTDVELEVHEAVAGVPPDPLVLRVLGGRMGSRTLAIDGAPEFHVGETGFFFIQGNGTQIVPIVALQHGVYPIRRDSDGTDRVLRHDGSPLRDETDVARPLGLTAAGSDSQALTAEQFTARIQAARAHASLDSAHVH